MMYRESTEHVTNYTIDFNPLYASIHGRDCDGRLGKIFSIFLSIQFGKTTFSHRFDYKKSYFLQKLKKKICKKQFVSIFSVYFIFSVAMHLHRNFTVSCI